MTAQLVWLAVVAVAAGCSMAPPKLQFEAGTIDAEHVVAKVDAVAIVVDGSLSMADPSRRQPKLDIATGVAGAIAATPPKGMLDGAVYSFGQGSCLPPGPTSELYGFSSYDPTMARDAVTRIRCANGLSPLDAALRAVDGDAGRPDGLAIIIVSDGMQMGKAEISAAKAIVNRLGADGVCFHPVQVGYSERGAALLGKIAALTPCSTMTDAADLVGADVMGTWVKERLFEDDTDGDGVPDRLDQCPDTPRGVEVDAKGCPLDSDGDGVPDYLDKCPNTPKGAPVDAQGCPLDSDGDGVADYLDKCPGTPKGTPVDADGCPLVGVRVEGDEWHVEGNVLFDLNKDAIKPDAKPVLDGIADWLQRNQGVNLVIEGHTDDTGSAGWNQTLSERRAASAKAYLVGKGVAPERISTVGKGESDPFVPNDSAENRARNRRVEFHPQR